MTRGIALIVLSLALEAGFLLTAAVGYRAPPAAAPRPASVTAVPAPAPAPGLVAVR